jgi:putative aldouronate transport system permease protein
MFALSFRLRRRLSTLVLHMVLAFCCLLFLLPLLMVLSSSLSSEQRVVREGFTLIPKDFTLTAYSYILSDTSQLVNAYGVTILVTVIGTVVGLFLMALMAYTLSRADFAFRRPLSFFVFFTLLFNGGLVPSYILIARYLQLRDTLAVLILPSLIVPWYVLLLRAFFAGLPGEIIDAAKVDGAGEWRTFFQIVLPLSTPALATIGLFSALMYWNDWFLALLYISEERLIPLQYLLYRIQSNITFLATSPFSTGIPVPTFTVRLAMAVLTTAPLVVLFGFVQKYLVRGIALGGLKG